MRLADWPENDDKAQWGVAPYSDLGYALDTARTPTESVALDDVAEVVRYYISYHGTVWAPGDDNGSELEMFIVGKLHDGHWFGLEGWNDYTGWGCQDGADLYVGSTEDDVVRNGITESARSVLGYDQP